MIFIIVAYRPQVSRSTWTALRRGGVVKKVGDAGAQPAAPGQAPAAPGQPMGDDGEWPAPQTAPSMGDFRDESDYKPGEGL